MTPFHSLVLSSANRHEPVFSIFHRTTLHQGTIALNWSLSPATHPGDRSAMTNQSWQSQ